MAATENKNMSVCLSIYLSQEENTGSCCQLILRLPLAVFLSSSKDGLSENVMSLWMHWAQMLQRWIYADFNLSSNQYQSKIHIF